MCLYGGCDYRGGAYIEERLYLSDRPIRSNARYVRFFYTISISRVINTVITCYTIASDPDSNRVRPRLELDSTRLDSRVVRVNSTRSEPYYFLSLSPVTDP